MTHHGWAGLCLRPRRRWGSRRLWLRERPRVELLCIGIQCRLPNLLRCVLLLFSVILLLFAGWTGSLHPLGGDLRPPLVLCITKHRRGDAGAVGLAAATVAVAAAAAAVNETILSTCFRFIFDQIS